MMGIGGSGSSNDTDDGDDDDEGIPPEQTTIGDQSVDEGSSDDNSSGAGAAGEAAGAAVGGGGAASGGGGAAVGGAAATGGGAAGGGSSSGETKDPEETEEEEKESGGDETNESEPPEDTEPEAEHEPPEPEQPERSEEGDQQDVDEEEEEDDDQEPQEAELVIYTDAWDATGWGIEPVLKKLEQDFGLSFDLSYKLFTPRELDSNDWGSSRYDMPYTQVVELPDDTKLSTSALHVAQELDQDIFRDYLRRLRIAALVEGRNIEDRDLLIELAGDVGFDTDEFDENWYGDIDDIGEFETMPIIQATVGDHEISWSGHLEYGHVYSVLLDNDVLPVGGSSTLNQLVGEYGPVTTTEIEGITGDDREQIEAEVEGRQDVVRVEYGDAGFWDQT
ncbi:hypothetical protein [Halorubrum sp. Atlit-26R]|uniref:hypothetical protein n=1 Tax=Halorubrum sp. Atlit-26R TaxID=2282128 RepID=UPI000EF26FD6|nr:hypothetical protein [Halorubrum sp. Atlit-26R]RLM72570.1 hypothetical protein DVK07_06115 [Halorubrum sp. Atlit-26R]